MDIGRLRKTDPHQYIVYRRKLDIFQNSVFCQCIVFSAEYRHSR